MASTTLELSRQVLQEKQTKVLPENIKKDVKIFGVTGTYEGSGGTGDVKLFETVEEMQQDPNPQEGDLAVVYNVANNELDGTLSGTIICTDSFTLEEALTTYKNIYYYPINETQSYYYLYFYINPTQAYIRDYKSGQYLVRYTSSDGLTYTASSNITPYDLSYSYTASALDNIDIFTNFVTVKQSNFEGLFIYNNEVVDYDILQGYGFTNIIDLKYTGIPYTTDNTFPYKIKYNDLYEILHTYMEDVNTPGYGSNKRISMYVKDNKYYILASNNSYVFKLVSYNNDLIGIGDSYSYTNITTLPTFSIYELDLSNKTYTLIQTLNASVKSVTYSSGTVYQMYVPILPDSLVISLTTNNIETNNYTFNTSIFVAGPVEGQSYDTYRDLSPETNPNQHPFKRAYIQAPNQLSLTASQALTNTKAYSRNGIIEGIMTNLGSRTITPSLESQTIESGYTTGVTIKAVDSNVDPNIVPINIRENNSILGVEGTCMDVKAVIEYEDKTLTTKRSADAGSPNSSGQHNVVIMYDLHGNTLGCIKWGSEYRSTYFYLYGYNKNTDQFVNSTYVSLSTPFRNIYDSGKTVVSYVDDYGIAYLWFQSRNQTSPYYSDLCCMELKYNYSTNKWTKGENYWMYDLRLLYTGSYTPRDFYANEKKIFINPKNRAQLFISGFITAMKTSSETSNLETTYHTATFELGDNHTINKLSHNNHNLVDYIAMGNIFNDGKLIIYNGVGDNYYDEYQSYKTDMIVLDDDFKIVKISKALGRIQYYDPKSDRVVMSTSGKQYSLYKINIDYSTGDITYTLLQTLGTNNLHTNNIISLDGKYLLDWHCDFMTLYQNKDITLYEVDLDATNIYKPLITDVYGTSESSGTLAAYDRDRVFITLTSRYNGSPVRWFRPTRSKIMALEYKGTMYYPEN